MKIKIYRINNKVEKEYLYAFGFTANEQDAEVYNSLNKAIIAIPRGVEDYKSIVIEKLPA